MIKLEELYILKSKLEKNNFTNEPYYETICEEIEIRESELLNEDTSATGGPTVSGGMGAVVSAQPSGLAGATIGTNWASGGGTVGSGDISVPYNPSGVNRVFQKIPVMSKNHGARTGKKSRIKKLDLQTIKNVFAKRQDFTAGQGDGKGKSKVMNFDDFQKSDVNKVKK